MIDMELPDKIYVTTCSINSWYGYKFGCWTERECPGYAYIRKDALLEWAKKEMGEWSSESNTAQGVKMGLTLVLDKIESL